MGMMPDGVRAGEGGTRREEVVEDVVASVALFGEEEGAGRTDGSPLCGTVEAVTYHNEANGYTVARLRLTAAESVTLVGTMAAPQVGETLECTGRWERHAQYGRQFRAVTCRTRQPVTTEGIELYLGGGLFPGVGMKTAKALVRHFGMEALNVIENSPGRLTEVTGIGTRKARQMAEAWEEQRGTRETMLFLQGHGISIAQAMKIHREYGDQTVAVVRSNPYRLARDIFGIGFRSADRIAQRMGIAQDAPERVEAGVVHCMRVAQDDGHCYLPEARLTQGAAELLGGTPAEGTAPPGEPPTQEAVAEAVERLVHMGMLIREPGAEEGRSENKEEGAAVYERVMYGKECELAANLARVLEAAPKGPRGTVPGSADGPRGTVPRSAHDSPRGAEDGLEAMVDAECAGMGVALAGKQREAVLTALTCSAMVLTGGPGTGKTTTTRVIVGAHQRLGHRVLLASPTGRAAKRLAEVAGWPAQTIHRMLEVDPATFAFRRDERNPLDCDVLVVDEASMLDLALAHALVRAVPKGARLLLVGDVDQLPSVGPGNVLRDIIASEAVPVVRLTEVFRQAAESAIVRNAHMINHGEMPYLAPTREWRTSDCLFVPLDDAEAAAEKVADVVGRSLPVLGFSRDEIQVLTPMLRGPLGARSLNERLQQAQNPAAPGRRELVQGATTLRTGDRVIQTVNNYEKDVFNGDIGYIVHVDEEERAVVVRYPDKEVGYGRQDLEDLSLAYALTVHKSQGSEYPAVVLALHTQHYMMLQRNLLYTALTRARRCAVVVGSRRAVGIAVGNSRVGARFTRLAERLSSCHGADTAALLC